MPQDLSLLAGINTRSEEIGHFHLLRSYSCLFVLIFTNAAPPRPPLPPPAHQ